MSIYYILSQVYRLMKWFTKSSPNSWIKSYTACTGLDPYLYSSGSSCVK